MPGWLLGTIVGLTGLAFTLVLNILVYRDARKKLRAPRVGKKLSQRRIRQKRRARRARAFLLLFGIQEESQFMYFTLLPVFAPMLTVMMIGWMAQHVRSSAG